MRPHERERERERKRALKFERQSVLNDEVVNSPQMFLKLASIRRYKDRKLFPINDECMRARERGVQSSYIYIYIYTCTK